MAQIASDNMTQVGQRMKREADATIPACEARSRLSIPRIQIGSTKVNVPCTSTAYIFKAS